MGTSLKDNTQTKLRSDSANVTMSVNISSRVIGDKNVEFTWRGRRYFLYLHQ